MESTKEPNFWMEVYKYMFQLKSFTSSQNLFASLLNNQTMDVDFSCLAAVNRWK